MIPAEAELKLNIRTFDARVRERVLAAVERIVTAEATAAGTPTPEIAPSNDFPLLTNDEDATRRVMAAFTESFGAEAVHEPPMKPASEDFGRFGAAARGSRRCSGTSAPSTRPTTRTARPDLAVAAGTAPGNHSPDFVPDAIDAALSRGTVARHCRAALSRGTEALRTAASLWLT